MCPVYARRVTMGKGGERGLPPKKNGDVLSYLARPALVRRLPRSLAPRTLELSAPSLCVLEGLHANP